MDDFLNELRRDLATVPSPDLLISLRSLYDEIVPLLKRYLETRAAFRRQFSTSTIDQFRSMRDLADSDLKKLMEAKVRLDLLVSRLADGTNSALSHFKDDLYKMFELLHK